MFKNLTKTVVVLSAFILLLAGCGSADPEPTAATPPPNESAVQQEPEIEETQEPADVVASLGDADIDTSDWVTVELEIGTVSVPPTWEIDYGSWGSMIFSGDGATSDTLFMDTDIVMSFADVEESTGRFIEIVNEANSSEEFVFNDGYVGFMLEYPTFISWARSDSWLHLSFRHGGARSHFAANEELITAIARTFITPIFEASETPDIQPPAQMTGTPVEADIDYIESLLIDNDWTFEGPGGLLSGAHYDTLGFPQNRFWSIDFYEGGTGELLDFIGEDEADFVWALIDDTANGRIVLNIFSAWLDPQAYHAGLWYEVSLSTLGVQRILTLHDDRGGAGNATLVTSGW